MKRNKKKKTNNSMNPDSRLGLGPSSMARKPPLRMTREIIKGLYDVTESL